MVRTTANESAEQKLLDDIRQFGWHCVHVLGEGEQPSFSFTIGLFQTYGHPELLLYGLPRHVAHSVLNLAAELVQDGRALDLAQPTDALFHNFPSVFVEVPRARYREYLGWARWYYQGDAFPAYQIVWPSKTGLFPWHAAATKGFRQAQPVLGQPAKAA